MIPDFNEQGNLPAGVHEATWDDFVSRFGYNTHRLRLIGGLKAALKSLQFAGCREVYIDGSFVTSKIFPNDFDGCWDVTNVNVPLLDPILLDLRNQRAKQKAKFLGELFPAQLPEGVTGKTFLDFFQRDKNSGDEKGIIRINLRSEKL